jgi:Coenzyme PQQ synthesis protein D (PqqD)
MFSETVVGLGSVPCRKYDLRVRKYRGKFLVATAGNAIELNAEAEYIFKHIDDSATLAEIAADLSGQYDVALDDALADVAEFITTLVANDIIELRD